MILGTGLDLMDVARMKKMIENKRFLERVFSAEERGRIAERGAATAAGLFAAKEAVAKAFGTGFREFCAWDIEILPDELGAPHVRLCRGALARREAMGGGRIHLSITHVSGMAAAVAILTDEKEDATP